MRGKNICFLLALLVVSGGNPCAEGMVYKCKDPHGSLIYQGYPCKQSEQPISSWAASNTPSAVDDEPANAPGGVYVIKQRGNGHYFLEGKINGKALSFVVDTGASTVSLPRNIAYLAQISCKEQIQLRTAGGSTIGCTAVIAKLRFGPYLMKDVPAVIVPNLDQPLLGMNVLNQFNIEQSNGEMRISMRANSSAQK